MCEFIAVIPVGNVTDVNARQLSKQLRPMYVTEFGITYDGTAYVLENAAIPIYFKAFGIVNEVT